MKESNLLRRLLIASAVVVMSIPAIAGATPHVNDAGQTVVSVSYADLNLSSEAGLATLYRRLKGASEAACGPQRSLRAAGGLQQLVNNKTCYSNVLSSLVAKVNNERLSEIHMG